MTMQRGWTRPLRWMQVILIVAVFGLDFAHGIRLGVHDIGFHPIYRVRQSLAVAISRLREPPLGGYLAYQSVLDALNRHGFAIYPRDAGPPPSVERWRAVLMNADALESALEDAKTTPINTTLQPQVIIINELGYADYMYLGFLLFGVHMSSLYYLYFTLLGVSCLLFVSAYRRSPFLMLLLTTYLAGLFFLQDYAVALGIQGLTLVNSRLFEALALLPALHIFLAIWQRAPLRLTAFLPVAYQAALLLLLAACRTTVWWQIGLIFVVSASLTLAGLRRGHSHGKSRWAPLWPAMVAAVLLVMHVTTIHVVAAPRYATEPKIHVIWHEVLIGLLGASPELQRLYLGKEYGITFDDELAYFAVVSDLNARNDKSSPIAFIHDGRIDLDASISDIEYERLQREVAFKIVRDHPSAVAAGIINKFAEQLRMYRLNGAMTAGAFGLPALIVSLGALLWIMVSGETLSARALAIGAAALLIILAFSTVPVIIEPSFLSVGTLLCFLVAGVVTMTTLVAQAVKQVRPATSDDCGREIPAEFDARR
jgi:hypothetical protein